MAALALLACACHGLFAAASLPTGFSEATINGPSGAQWNEAVGMYFEDNGRMYVWERAGRVWIREYGSSAWSVLIDISEEVGYWRDFGLLGFTVDPNFRVNGCIYLMYVVDRHHLLNFGTGSYNPAADEYFDATIGRITRYTARAADGFASVDYNTRHVLLGETKSTGFPILHESHSVGSLVFGTDGTLLASCGDGSSFSTMDTGSASETYYSQALSDGIIKPKENIGSYRSQLVDSLNGKIVRIDPATGDGIPSNPFYDAANPRSARSRVWALGLRNPFRMTIRPGTGSHHQADGNPGVLYIGDVGWSTWEELDVCTGPGQNFGWPVFEGIEPSSFASVDVENLDALNPLYPGAGCSQYLYFTDLIKQNTSVVANQPPFDNPCDSAQKIPGTIPQFLHTLPALDWRHEIEQARTWVYDESGVATDVDIDDPESPVSGSMFPGNCSIGGVWYMGNDFPEQYRNTYFHADFGTNWIQSFVFDTNNQPVSVASFLSGGGGIVALATHPLDGGLYYLAYTSETSTTLRKISYSESGNLPPTALASSDKTYGPGPLTVQFTGSGSTDPEGLPLTYDWDFGDGTPNSTAADPLHTFNAPAGVPTPYTITLTVMDDAGQSSTTSLLISVNNTPPTVTIASPVDRSRYSMAGNSVFNLTAAVTDNESTDDQLRYEWQTVLHHNNHEHPDPVNTNHTTTTVISPAGCDGNTYYYRILLRVTDPAGLSTRAEVHLFPDCTNQPPLSITTSSLAIGRVTVAYTATLIASGGIPPYTWSIFSGSLPSGVALNTNSGSVNGTPTEAGIFNFTAEVSDSSGPVQTARRPLGIFIDSLPTTMGNTNQGTLVDTMGIGWINAERFQAIGNLMVSTMFAEIDAIAGSYKCAIYSDANDEPDRLLRASAEVSNPSTGWRAFPLTSPLVLTNGHYYWLAIWSDDADSRVYYTDTAGTLRWGFYDYGEWPDPVATTGSSSANYCIYATGPGSPHLVITPLDDGSYRIRFDGVSGLTYGIEYTDTLNPANWQNLTNHTANEAGLFEIIDTPLSNSPQRFYRSVYP